MQMMRSTISASRDGWSSCRRTKLSRIQSSSRRRLWSKQRSKVLGFPLWAYMVRRDITSSCKREIDEQSSPTNTHKYVSKTTGSTKRTALDEAISCEPHWNAVLANLPLIDRHTRIRLHNLLVQPLPLRELPHRLRVQINDFHLHRSLFPL